MLIRIIFAVVFSSSFSSLAMANEYSGTLTLKFENTPLQDINYFNKKISLKYSIQINWKLWTLLGEPVIDSKARWIFHSLTIQEGNSSRTYNYCNEKEGEFCLPAKVIKDIKLLDLEFFARSELYNENRYALILNPGVIGPASIASFGDSQFSYNTPESMAWDRTFVKPIGRDYFLSRLSVNPEKKITPDYFDKNTSKSMFSNGVNLYDLIPYKFSAGYSSVLKYLSDKEEQEQINKLKKTIQSEKNIQLGKIKNHTKDDIFSEFEAEMATQDTAEEFKTKSKQVAERMKKHATKIDALERSELLAISAIKFKIDNRALPQDALISFQDEQTKKYGYKNSQDQVVIPPRFSQANKFSEGLAAVGVRTDKGSEKFGYINTKGEWVIEARFDEAHSFRNGKATVVFEVDYNEKSCDKWRNWKQAVIDKSGAYASKITKHSIGQLCLRRE